MTREETLEAEIRILLDSVNMMEQAIEDWKALPLKEHFESAAMIEALARVEAAVCYEKRLLAELERAREKENPRQERTAGEIGKLQNLTP